MIPKKRTNRISDREKEWTRREAGKILADKARRHVMSKSQFRERLMNDIGK